MKTNPIVFLLTAAAVLTGNCLALTPITEDFQASKLDKTRWYLFPKIGKGRFSQSNGKLNFLVSAPPTQNDYINMELQASQPGMYENWEMILELSNSIKSGHGVQASPGFILANEQDSGDRLYVNFFGSSGIDAGFYNNGARGNAKPLTLNGGVPKGAIKVSYSKRTKLMTFSASPVTKEGYSWIPVGTFAPNGNGSGKKNVNADWKIDPTSGRFRIQLTGFAISKAVRRGEISIDNFSLLPP
ncbi:MAG: hypothetical protein V4689_04920 [Verrucomicrobiota bacterium]